MKKRKVHIIVKTKEIVFFILIYTCIALSQSCSQHFKEEDLSWIPYELNDTLVFKNSENYYDTIIINEVTKAISPYMPLNGHIFEIPEYILIDAHVDRYNDTRRFKELTNSYSSNQMRLNVIFDNTFLWLDLDTLTNSAKIYDSIFNIEGYIMNNSGSITTSNIDSPYKDKTFYNNASGIYSKEYGIIEIVTHNGKKWRLVIKEKENEED